MQNIIEIKGLNHSYGDKCVFNKMNLDIKPKRFATILGKNGSGKTTLTNILMGLVDYDGKIVIDGIVLSNDTKKLLRRNIGIIFENPDEHFVTDKVLDELAFVLESMDYQPDDIDMKIKSVVELLRINDLLERRITTLSIAP